MRPRHDFRSCTSYRVRMALALERLARERLPVRRVRGEQLREPDARLSASRRVPLWADPGHPIGRSATLIESLDELHPEPPLPPGSALDRARIRGPARDLACDMHPSNNLRVLRYRPDGLHVGEARKKTGYRHGAQSGLRRVERQRGDDPRTGRFCLGHAPTRADGVSVPPIHKTWRFECRLDDVPTAMRVCAQRWQLPAFASSQPSSFPESPA